MSFTAALPLQPAQPPNSSGVTLALYPGTDKRRPYVRLTMTEVAQIALFERKLDADVDKLDLLIGKDADAGKLMLRLHQSCALKITRTKAATCYVKLTPWHGLPKEAQKATECKILGDPITDDQSNATVVEITAPLWAAVKTRAPFARAPFDRAAMDSEFGIKPVKREAQE